MNKVLQLVFVAVSATWVFVRISVAGGFLENSAHNIGNAIKQVDPTNKDSQVSHITGSVVDTNKLRIFNPPPPPQPSTFTDPVYDTPPQIQYIPDGEDLRIKNMTGAVVSFHVWVVPRGSTKWVKLNAQILQPTKVGEWTIPWKDGIATTKDEQNRMHYAMYVEGWSPDERQKYDQWFRSQGLLAQRVGFRANPTQQQNVFSRRPWVEFDLIP
jgi:hypothetical protein